MNRQSVWATLQRQEQPRPRIFGKGGTPRPPPSPENRYKAFQGQPVATTSSGQVANFFHRWTVRGLVVLTVGSAIMTVSLWNNFVDTRQERMAKQLALKKSQEGCEDCSTTTPSSSPSTAPATN